MAHSHQLEHVALGIAAVAVVPMIAFAVLWASVLGALAVMWLWYSGTLIPVSLIAAGLAYYLVTRRK